MENSFKNHWSDLISVFIGPGKESELPEVTQQIGSTVFCLLQRALFFAQTFEGKIRMYIMHGCNEYVPWV